MSETPVDVTAIRARLEAATPGPWFAYDRGVGFEIAIEPGAHPRLIEGGMKTDIGRREDAELIAHAPEDLSSLLSRIEDLEAGIANDLVSVIRTHPISEYLHIGEAESLAGAITAELSASVPVTRNELAEWLCKEETMGSGRSFDEAVAPGRRLWERYLPEADALLSVFHVTRKDEKK